ncbi:hypothetical protein D3C71_1294470 [compost metagenome]
MRLFKKKQSQEQIKEIKEKEKLKYCKIQEEVMKYEYLIGKKFKAKVDAPNKWKPHVFMITSLSYSYNTVIVGVGLPYAFKVKDIIEHFEELN